MTPEQSAALDAVQAAHAEWRRAYETWQASYPDAVPAGPLVEALERAKELGLSYRQQAESLGVSHVQLLKTRRRHLSRAGAA